MKDLGFQKWLAYLQIFATVGAAIGGIIVSIGISSIGFSQDLAAISVSFDNDTDKEGINQLIQHARMQGNSLFFLGILVIFLIPAISIGLIHILKEKAQSYKKSKNPILFDEMYDGKDIELANKGYETFSVKKLRLQGEELHYDFSVLKYVEKNKMILITEDPENYGGCIENDLLCIKLGQNPSIEEIVNALESLKKSDSER